MDNDDEFGSLYTDVLRVNRKPTTSLVFHNLPADGSEDSNAALQSSIRPEHQSTSPEDAEVDWLLGREAPLVEEPVNWADDDEEVVVVPRASRDAAADLPFKLGGPRVFEKEADIRTFVEKTADIGDLDEEPVIPGLLNGGLVKASGSDDWDSDSEDDLQIVLNETVHDIGGERREGGASDEDDEDLVIVTDEDQHHHHHQVMDEQDLGDDAVQTSADGEKKEMLEVVKANGVAASVSGARIGYSNHGLYPQYHSNFKYVRPGAAPTPGGSGIIALGVPGQVRPSAFGPMAGRGRGEWRPVGGRGFPNMQKGFHSGFGLPAWTNSASGRPFGSGLDFILPSHKTVFDIDIESFEEKPWRHPGVDVSDFFNFGLDEENWKEYCKQVEQLRLESTMQSKIRVYESGRSEQDYDPDLPPELAAATGHHDMSADNTNHIRPDNEQADLSEQGRGSLCMRPPLPTGRAIQVEGGYGERLPSIDTRPPRIRDSDAVIEIVLQDNLEDSTISNSALERQENNFGEHLKGFHDVDEDGRPVVSEYYDGFPRASSGKQRESMARIIPLSHEGDGILPCPSELSLRRNSSPKPRSPMDSARSFGTQHVRRLSQGTSYGNSSTSEHSNETPPIRGVNLDKHEGHHKEKADEMETNQTPVLSPSNTVEVARELSIEPKDVGRDDRFTLGDSLEGDGEEASDFRVSSETVDVGGPIHSAIRKKSTSCVEHLAVQGNGDGNDSKLTHSDSSRAKSGNSRDHQKRHESGEEVMQDRPSKRTGDFLKHHGEDERRRRDDYGQDGRRETERNHATSRGREIMLQSYAHKDWDSGSEHTFRGRLEGFEREVDGSIGAWQRREDDAHSRQIKDENVRRGRDDQIRPRERSKSRVPDRNEKIEDHMNKSLDGDWRGHSKNGFLRHRERDDILMNRVENREDSQMRRKRDAELCRRERTDREDSLLSSRAREDSSRRKRERDDIVDHRKREDDVRTKSKTEEHQSSNHKEDNWNQRDRADRQRFKLSHDDTFSSRERERRLASRSARPIEEKALTGSGKSKEDLKVTGSDKDYHHKDRRRHNEQSKRGEHTVEEHDSLSRVRGGSHATHSREKRFNTEERSMRHERLSTQTDRPSGASDGLQVQKERHRESSRKIKDTELVRQSREVYGKRKHEDHNTHRTEINSKGSSVKESSKHSTTEGKKAHGNADEQMVLAARHGEEDPASDDENHESRRGRSKLERWTSHKERDYSTIDNNIQSSPSMIREVEDSQSEVNEPVKADAPKTENTETMTADVDQVADKGGEVADRAGEERDRHLDTVAKLKMRSERFKLPMPGEKDKDLTGLKKVENEAPLCIQNEAASTAVTDMDIKLERPARKRRWTDG